MATATGFTAERMKAIEASCVVTGGIVLDHLWLTTRDGTKIDAGYVRGDKGDKGDKGDQGIKGVQGDQGIKGDSALAAGTIVTWAGDTAPSNWLICDGSLISRTTYASLFAAIGTKYGAGDGTTTFALPNLKGKVPVGLDAAQTEFNLLGKTGGEKTHILTTAEMPSHTHIQDAHGHSLSNDTFASAGHGHTLSTAFAMVSLNAVTSNQVTMRRISTSAYTPTHGLTPSSQAAAGYTTTTTSGAALGGSTDSASSTTTTGIYGATATNQNTGGGGAHNNLQPYSVFNFIIKTTNGDTPSDSQLTQRVSTLETSVSPAMFELRDKMTRLKGVFTGGGARKVSGTGFGWSQRFILLGAGKDQYSPTGYFDIAMPPNGTVIPVYGNTSVSSVTVANGMIPYPDTWVALYYDVPIGQSSASKPGNFKFVGYNADVSLIPSTWVLVAVRNNDARSPMITWGDGRGQDFWKPITLAGGWSEFGGGYASARWKIRDDGNTELKGLVKGGGTGVSNMIGGFGAELAPEETEMFTVASAAGGARVDMLSTGELIVYSYFGGGSNSYVSISGINWVPKGV